MDGELDEKDMNYIVNHDQIQAELRAWATRRRLTATSSSNIPIASFDTSADNLHATLTVKAGHDDIVYLLNEQEEEQTFVVHGVVGHALLPKESVLRSLKLGAEHLVHRLLLTGGHDVSFESSRIALAKVRTYMKSMRGDNEFVNQQREFSSALLPAICVEAPILSELKTGDGFSAKESIEVPIEMDPSAYIQRFLASQPTPSKFAFTDDNWVSYGEFEEDENKMIVVKDISPEELRPGHVVEVVFSVRGVRQKGTRKRLIRNHLTSASILCKKGIMLVHEKKSRDSAQATAKASSSTEKKLPVKRRRIDPVDLRNEPADEGDQRRKKSKVAGSDEDIHMRDRI